MSMTAEQRIKRHILMDVIAANDDLTCDGEITAENVDDVWDAISSEYCDMEAWVYDFRDSGDDTGLPSQVSRHYEAREVGRKLCDGTWVGWTYWYGGGKHGEPEAIEWMSEAYDLDVTQETRVVNVFKRK